MPVADLKNYENIFSESFRFLAELNHEFQPGGLQQPDFAQWCIFRNQLAELCVIQSVLRPELFPFVSRVFELAEEEPSELWLLNVQRLIKDCFLGAGVEVSVATKDLGKIQVELQSARRSASNLISWFWWTTFSIG